MIFDISCISYINLLFEFYEFINIGLPSFIAGHTKAAISSEINQSGIRLLLLYVLLHIDNYR